MSDQTTVPGPSVEDYLDDFVENEEESPDEPLAEEVSPEDGVSPDSETADLSETDEELDDESQPVEDEADGDVAESPAGGEDSGLRLSWKHLDAHGEIDLADPAVHEDLREKYQKGLDYDRVKGKQGQLVQQLEQVRNAYTNDMEQLVKAGILKHRLGGGYDLAEQSTAAPSGPDPTATESLETRIAELEQSVVSGEATTSDFVQLTKLNREFSKQQAEAAYQRGLQQHEHRDQTKHAVEQAVKMIDQAISGQESLKSLPQEELRSVYQDCAAFIRHSPDENGLRTALEYVGRAATRQTRAIEQARAQERGRLKKVAKKAAPVAAGRGGRGAPKAAAKKSAFPNSHDIYSKEWQEHILNEGMKD